MTYLLDTCILSKLRKISKRPDPALQTWITKHAETQFFVSVITIGEILQGINKLENIKERRVLEEWVRADVMARFDGRILNIDLQVSSTWGLLAGAHLRKGSPLPVLDSLIGATAIAHNLILVTENVKDFARIDTLMLYSPWESVR